MQNKDNVEDHNLTPYNHSKNRHKWHNIECHKRFKCVILITDICLYTNLYLYISKRIAFIVATLLLSHIIGHIIFFFNYFFSSFLTFILPIPHKKNLKKKKKKLFFSLLVIVTLFSNLYPSSLSLYLPTTLYFIITLLSSLLLSYILTLLLLILFCINLVPFLPCNPYFSHKITVSILSLSWWIFVLSYNFFLWVFLIILIMVDFYFLNICFG